jgi:hypothetical protein
MTDTWQDLERRFHEVGNRPGKVVLQFSKRDDERYWWSLSGPVIEGEFRLNLVGKTEPFPCYGTSHYAVQEIADLLQRAGKMLIDHDDQAIWKGADIFVARTVEGYRLKWCHDPSMKDEVFILPNAGRIFGMMAGRLCSAKIKNHTSSASNVDRDRLRFYEDQKAKNQRLRYKDAADLWNKKEQDHCDEGSFKQSCWRARQNVTT